jgi:phosphatidate cytidylyltransferase
MKTRVVSAALALLLLGAIYFVFKIGGLLMLAAVATALAIREFGRLTFCQISPARLPLWLFSVFCFLIYLGFAYGAAQSEALFAVLSILFVIILLSLSNGTEKLSRITLQQGLGIMGFMYCGLFPALATRLIRLPEGDLWFFTLLAIVFLGDSGAYFMGKAFGKKKLMPKLSPQKTHFGALGGLLGSLVAGLLARQLFFADHSPFGFAAVSVLTGGFAQAGDLFESLLKRIANVKDSGRIMPGHGGVLDRLDGIFFGAPIFYYLVIYLLS